MRRSLFELQRKRWVWIALIAPEKKLGFCHFFGADYYDDDGHEDGDDMIRTIKPIFVMKWYHNEVMLVVGTYSCHPPLQLVLLVPKCKAVILFTFSFLFLLFILWIIQVSWVTYCERMNSGLAEFSCITISIIKIEIHMQNCSKFTKVCKCLTVSSSPTFF